MRRVTSKPASAPLFLVTGAPGVGKTTLLPELVRLGKGLVVIDQDELLDEGALLGVPIAFPDAAPNWPAYNRMWDRIVHIVRRAGHPVLLLGPTPYPEEPATTADPDGPVHWALLDCADELRRARLRTRGWSTEWIEDAVADAAETRELIPTVITTDDEDAEKIALRILSWTATLGEAQ
ncbi:Broad-specificity NMP kinase [Actinopolymorpha cephalotaxi]|uniref:Broad-specificity NMP kinase n=1 Tax=Actinopolymorpha cephalotaxi TaxID=504797 RepID=A0A1I2X8G0_9ACTN|nr:Broad-specificity NMP kinase [Actinopolymorpha cephalotaxi]